MRESFFAQGRAYAELRRIEQLCETGNFDAITTAPTSKSRLSIAVANGILPRARRKQYTLDRILELICSRVIEHCSENSDVKSHPYGVRTHLQKPLDTLFKSVLD
jgi:hypothetical protein